MSDLSALVAFLRARDRAREELTIATIVETRGPSYRKPGARMLIAIDGKTAGSISGGCLEADLIRKAEYWSSNGPRLVTYDSTDPDETVAASLGCGGTVDVLVERASSADARFALRCLERSVVEQRPFAL